MGKYADKLLYGGGLMKILNHDVKLQAYSYQKTVERESKYLEVEFGVEQEAKEKVGENNLDLPARGEIKSNQILDNYEEDDEFVNMTILELWIRAITGENFKFKKHNNPVEADSKRLQMSGMRLRLLNVSEYHETEKMNFQSSGVIETEDGESIDFNLNLQFSREYYEKNVTVITMGKELKDPLVINLDGKGVGFSDEKLKIDLNMDGKIDQFNRLNAGNGFLALDKNSNGKIDDGSELFGPKSGKGFKELSQYDSDKNGWIDESDSIFDDLKVWKIDEQGKESLIAIKEVGIGAIYLGSVGSQFDIKDGRDLIARITDSSIYIKENGMAAAIQQVDVNFRDSMTLSI